MPPANLITIADAAKLKIKIMKLLDSHEASTEKSPGPVTWKVKGNEVSLREYLNKEKTATSKISLKYNGKEVTTAFSETAIDAAIEGMTEIVAVEVGGDEGGDKDDASKVAEVPSVAEAELPEGNTEDEDGGDGDGEAAAANPTPVSESSRKDKHLNSALKKVTERLAIESSTENILVVHLGRLIGECDPVTKAEEWWNEEFEKRLKSGNKRPREVSQELDTEYGEVLKRFKKEVLDEKGDLISARDELRAAVKAASVALEKYQRNQNPNKKARVAVAGGSKAGPSK